MPPKIVQIIVEQEDRVGYLVLSEEKKDMLMGFLAHIQGDEPLQAVEIEIEECEEIEGTASFH